MPQTITRPQFEPSQPLTQTQKELQTEHFKESPFGNSAQLNTFLMWFGIVSAVLIMAFVIQCCREIARNDEPPASPDVKSGATPRFDDPN